jgi:hypothetical protein
MQRKYGLCNNSKMTGIISLFAKDSLIISSHFAFNYIRLINLIIMVIRWFLVDSWQFLLDGRQKIRGVALFYFIFEPIIFPLKEIEL